MIKGLKILFRRLLAMLIDIGVILIYAIMLYIVVTQVIHYNGSDNLIVLNLISFLVMIVPGYLYFTVMEYKFRFTLGKKVLGLKISNHSDLMPLVIRNVLKLLPWQLGHMMVYSMYDKTWLFDTKSIIYLVLIYGLIGVNSISIVFSKSKQSVYDKLTNTFIVKIKSEF